MFNFSKQLKSKDEFAISEKYKGMPVEIVEELLKGEAVLADPKREAEAQKRRANIIEKIKEKVLKLDK
mgnify:FL=1